MVLRAENTCNHPATPESTYYLLHFPFSLVPAWAHLLCHFLCLGVVRRHEVKCLIKTCPSSFCAARELFEASFQLTNICKGNDPPSGNTGFAAVVGNTRPTTARNTLPNIKRTSRKQKKTIRGDGDACRKWQVEVALKS